MKHLKKFNEAALDNIDKERQRELNSQLMKVAKDIGGYSSNYYINTLFDPVQTHSLHGVRTEDVPRVKEELKKLGAKKFRMVSAGNGNKIICFDASNIN